MAVWKVMLLPSIGEDRSRDASSWHRNEGQHTLTANYLTISIIRFSRMPDGP